jgi:SAM-dependent methyltransferase
MLAIDVLAFAMSALPDAPAAVLEIGAGSGELAAALRTAGHDVTAIDPGADGKAAGVDAIPLIEARGSFAAALAVVSLHHVEPMEASFAHLATLLPHGAPLVVDEIDVDRLDERAVGWWLGQRRALGHEVPATAGEVIDDMRHHIHRLADVLAALEPWFALGVPVRGPYLHRWALEPGLRDAEERLIAAGRLPATGARVVGIRR